MIDIPSHIAELLNKPVRVYSPNDSSHWNGRLASYYAQPIIILSDLSGGVGSSGTILPAYYKMEELEPPPPPPRCSTCGRISFNPGMGTAMTIYDTYQPKRSS